MATKKEYKRLWTVWATLKDKKSEQAQTLAKRLNKMWNELSNNRNPNNAR